MSTVDDMIRVSELAIKFVDAIVGPNGGAPNKWKEIKETSKINTGYKEFDAHVSKTKAQQVWDDLQDRMTKIREEFAQAYPGGPDPWNAGKLNTLARLAIKYRAGQCHEQVAIAFHHLRVSGVKTIDLMALWSPSSHAFLIINRGRAEAVVCDPWSPWKRHRAYAATPEKLAQNLSMHPNTYAESTFTWRG
jgi:hypothetical protein